jgi:hypothetical protein
MKVPPGDALRYAVLEATLPDLAFATGRLRADSAPVLGCQVAVYELVGQCTMVTAASPVADHPQLARLMIRLGRALCAIARANAGTEAA